MEARSLIVILLILVSAIVSLELGVSVALLEIIAGVVAGNTLGDMSSQWIEFLAEFGIVGLMFFAGFETDEKLLRRYWRQSLLIGCASYFGPFILVVGCSTLVLGLPFRTAVLLAIGLSTTSLALVYSVLKDRGALNETWGQILLSSAMIVDVLSMMSLTVVFEGIGLWAVLLLAVVLLFLVSLSRVGKWVFSRYHGDTVEFKTRFILLVLLALELASSAARVHVAVLAFVTGIIFSEMMEEREQLVEKLKSIIFGFMAPLFFFKAGASIDLSQINGATILIVCVLAPVAFGGKYLASFLATKRYLKRPVPRFTGLVFNFRLTFGIIVASFGLHEGLIGQDVYTALLTIVLGSVILASALMRVVPHEV